MRFTTPVAASSHLVHEQNNTGSFVRACPWASKSLFLYHRSLWPSALTHRLKHLPPL